MALQQVSGGKGNCKNSLGIPASAGENIWNRLKRSDEMLQAGAGKRVLQRVGIGFQSIRLMESVTGKKAVEQYGRLDSSEMG